MNTDETSSTSLWAIGAGALAVLSGVVVLGFIGMRFIADAGWNGSGSGFRNQWQGLAPVLAALVATGLGVAALLTRRAALGTSPGRQAFVGVTALAALVAPLALLAYPRFSDAVLTGETWHTRLPVTQVLGMRSLTGDRLVIEGVEDHHECQFTLRALTLDLRTGRLLDVKDLPSTYPDISHVPPAPTPLDPARFTVDQGSSPFVCSS